MQYNNHSQSIHGLLGVIFKDDLKGPGGWAQFYANTTPFYLRNKHLQIWVFVSVCVY